MPFVHTHETFMVHHNNAYIWAYKKLKIMSTSLLYHGFGLTTQDYLKTEYEGGSVIFYTETKPTKLKCSNCGNKEVIKKGFKNKGLSLCSDWTTASHNQS